MAKGRKDEKLKATDYIKLKQHLLNKNVKSADIDAAIGADQDATANRQELADRLIAWCRGRPKA